MNGVHSMSNNQLSSDNDYKYDTEIDTEWENTDDDSYYSDDSSYISEVSLETKYYLRPAKYDSNDDSLTMDINSTTAYWNKNIINNNEFEPCGVRFEDDDWDGKKPPANEFRNNQFFFQFILERIHNRSQLLLDTALPVYQEWKVLRKVRIRHSNLKIIDHALKSCNESVDLLKCIVKNCIIIYYDNNQLKEYKYFDERYENEIPTKLFNIGYYSMMDAWDLFDNGASPKLVDWNIAIGLVMSLYILYNISLYYYMLCIFILIRIQVILVIKEYHQDYI